MDIGSRIKLLREKKNLAQFELAAILKISNSTLSQYETGARTPSDDMKIAIANYFDVSIDYLLGRESSEKKSASGEAGGPAPELNIVPPPSSAVPIPDTREPAERHSPKLDLPADAQRVAEDYAALDQPGKNVVKVVIAEEGKRVAAELRRQRERREQYDALSDLDGEPTEPRLIPLYYTPSAAGYASPAFGEDFEYLEVDGSVPAQADFAVKIDGDSMEPYLMDGSIAYVNRDPLANGDVGIFFVDGDMICKEYHRDRDGNVRLLSLNRARADADRYISADSGITFTCHGRVILPRR